MILRINKKAVYWTIVVLLELLAVIGWQGCDFSLKPPVSSAVSVTQAQADLVRGAITLVLNDLERGTIQTTDAALDALSSELPGAVRESVLKAIGKPAIEELPGVLAKVSEKMKIKE